MDVLSIAYKLIKSIGKRASEAKSNVADCEHLAELAGRTEEILTGIDRDALDNPSLLRALKAICEALELADEAIKDCCESSVFGALIRSQKHHDSLKSAALEIGEALDLIPLAMVGQTAADRNQIESLIGELRNAQFKQSLDSTTRMAELQRQLDINFNKSRDHVTQHNQQVRQGQEEITRMVKDLQLRIGGEEKAQADLKILRADLAEAKANKEAREEYQLEQIITVLESIEDKDLASTITEITNEPPAVIVCPISKEVMWDPVLVIESEMTYDRSSIEEWFALGNSTDPLTGKRLVSKQFVRNMAVRSEARAYLGTRGLPFLVCGDICRVELRFDPDTFGGYNNNPEAKNRHVSPYELSVTGHDWNRVNHVKTTRLLLQREWIGAQWVNGDQIGIGVSITRHSDGGIRFNDNSVGIYLDAQTAHWGKAEDYREGHLNKRFGYRLVHDPKGMPGMWICVDYTENKLWYRHPHMKQIDIDLPSTFRDKPLYGHYQVWNDKTLRFLPPARFDHYG